MCLARNPQMGAATPGLDLPLRRSPDSCSSRSAVEGRHVLEGNDCTTEVAGRLSLAALLLIFGLCLQHGLERRLCSELEYNAGMLERHKSLDNLNNI